MRVVDTAALAVALNVTPAHVRRLASEGKIAPVGKRMIRDTGRPTLVFDLDVAFKAIRGTDCEDPK